MEMALNRMSKKELAVGMYEKGMRCEAIAELLHTDPSYVANALIEKGHAPNYVDLYTSTGPQNRYAAMLSGILRFKDLEAAKASVTRINELYGEFEAVRDRRGMHQCQVLALVGKNRAEGIGKWQEAQVFADWLATHLQVFRPEPQVIQLRFPEPPEEVELPEPDAEELLLAA
jgi:hypothetical protein